MTKERQNEIKQEAERRTKLWLEHTTFDRMTFYGSFSLFNELLALHNDGVVTLEPGMDSNDFKNFVTEEEFHSKEYETALREVFYEYYEKYHEEEEYEDDGSIMGYDPKTERLVTKEFVDANILEAIVHHNGYKGGDAGHGGFVDITLSDNGSTSWTVGVTSKENKGVIINNPQSMTLSFKGDTERDTLIEALEFVLKELKENPVVA